MKNDWNNIDEKTMKDRESAIQIMENDSLVDWFDEGQINEIAFCEEGSGTVKPYRTGKTNQCR